MINRKDTKALVCLQGKSLTSKLSSFCTSTLESKIARTFTDDFDPRMGATTTTKWSEWSNKYRPGQRDDSNSCTHRHGRILPSLAQ